MARQDQLWMFLCGYLLASACMLFVYESHIRSYVIAADGLRSMFLPKRTRDASVIATSHKKKESKIDNYAEKQQHQQIDVNEQLDPFEYPNSRRRHSCTLPGNETLHTLEAPDLVIAGAQKGGTSAFYFLLKRHPHFSASKKFESHFFDWNFAVPPKELNNPTFWSTFNATSEDELLCAARKQYIEENFRVNKLIHSHKQKLTYEKTPNYMFLPSVPELIYKVCPWHPKIILILRNPVDRAYSHFVMDSSKQRVDLSFEKYIELEMETMRQFRLTSIPNLPASKWDSVDYDSAQMKRHFNHPPNKMTQEELDHAHWMVYRHRHMRNYLQRGIYSVQLERWMKFFPLHEKLLVIHNERLHREPRVVMGEVLEFLGAPRPDYFENPKVSVSFHEDGERPKKLSKSSSILSVGGYAPMPNATRMFLERFYQPYNDQLASVLGEDWRGVWDFDASAVTHP